MSDAFNQMLAQGPTPIKFADPVNQMAQLMQLKNAQQTGVVNQMAIDKGQRQQADQAAYRNMLAQPGFNANDPATQAQMYGLGFGADAADMATAKAAQQTAARETETRTLAAEGRAMDRYKAGFPVDGSTDVMRAYHTMAISSDPEIASAMSRNPGGLAGANAHFEEVINNPAAFQRFRDSILGESETTRANLAKLRAQELKALRPDAPPAAPQKTIKFENGQPYEYDPATGNIRALSLTGGPPATGGAAVAGPTSATGFPAPPKAAPTEAEVSGAGAGTRILGASNLINSAVATDPAAAAPTGAEAFLGGIPIVRRVVPSIQTGERQMVQNSYGELVDAALLLATGASATPDQKEVAMAAYSPGYLDKPQEKAAKKQRLITLIESSKIRAGRAWTPEQEARRKQIVAALESAPAASGGPAVGTVEDNHRFKGGDPAKAENWEPL